MDNVKYDYFEYNGKRYPVGTAIMLADKYADRLVHRYNQDTIIYKHYSSGDRHFYCVFDGYNAWGEVSCKIIEKSPDIFVREIVENPTITLESVNCRVKRRETDSENDDVKFGWLVYIVVMAGLFIFNDRWLGWIAATIYFFVWRNKKLKR